VIPAATLFASGRTSKFRLSDPEGGTIAEKGGGPEASHGVTTAVSRLPKRNNGCPVRWKRTGRYKFSAGRQRADLHKL